MQYGDEKREKLERLAKKLYSRNAPNIIGENKDVNEFSANRTDERAPEVKENWRDENKGSFDELAAKAADLAKKKHGLVKKIFLFSVLFFIIAAGVAAFIFFGGVNQVSSKNVDVKVTGPLSVGAGQEVSFDISVQNSNNVDLKSASLLVEYPAGTRSPDNLTKELDQQRFVLNSIKSGDSYTQNVKVVFFGEKDELKKINISVEYRVENSSALFYKEKDHEVSISSAPVILTPTYPKEVNSNQEMSFNIEAASNSKDNLGAFLVSAEYPFGFIFKEAVPAPTFGNNVWQVAGLKSGDKKTILIKGTIVGQDNEEKVFKISAGTASENDERAIAIPFTRLTESVLIKKSFIGLGVLINGREGNYVAQEGGVSTVQVEISNNLPSKIFNVSVQAALKGDAFNRSGVSVDTGGFFQSVNDTIIWDKRSLSSLSEMNPGSSRRLSFGLTPLSYEKITAGAKPEIEITVTTRGERILESGSVDQVAMTETRKIILGTNLSLSSKTVRAVGNIENSGPIPPKADTPTTYTVIWSISNSFNQVSNAEVRASLPSYVKWTNIKSPSSEIVSYDSVSNQVVWKAGSVMPNTGFGTSKKEVQFQLEFLPSISQVGQSPVLLEQISFSGIDKVTGLKIESSVGSATINFSGDPSFRSGDERVAP